MKTSLADINPCKEDEFIIISQIYLGVKVLHVMNDRHENNVFEQNEKEDFFFRRCREFLKVFFIYPFIYPFIYYFIYEQMLYIYFHLYYQFYGILCFNAFRYQHSKYQYRYDMQNPVLEKPSKQETLK